MAVIKMNCGETISLLSSTAFLRSPAGLLKYPSSSILRFPVKNSYNGVTTAARSNNNEHFLKIKEEGNGKVSMMWDEVKFIGQREDVEAAVVRAIRSAARRRIIEFGQIALVCILVFIHFFKSNFGPTITYLKTSWASGLTAWDHPLYVVTFLVIISKPISDKIKDRLEVLIQQQRMELNFIRNQERINALDSETKNLVIKPSNLIKSRTNDTEMKVITQLIEEEEESGNIEKYGGAENGQHMRED